MRESTQVDPRMRTAITRLKGESNSSASSSLRVTSKQRLTQSISPPNVASGKFKIAALTNNFSPPTEIPGGVHGKAAKAPTLDEELKHLGLGDSQNQLRKMFDFYIESAVVGKRWVITVELTISACFAAT